MGRTGSLVKSTISPSPAVKAQLAHLDSQAHRHGCECTVCSALGTVSVAHLSDRCHSLFALSLSGSRSAESQICPKFSPAQSHGAPYIEGNGMSSLYKLQTKPRVGAELDAIEMQSTAKLHSGETSSAYHFCALRLSDLPQSIPAAPAPKEMKGELSHSVTLTICMRRDYCHRTSVPAHWLEAACDLSADTLNAGLQLTWNCGRPAGPEVRDSITCFLFLCPDSVTRVNAVSHLICQGEPGPMGLPGLEGLPGAKEFPALQESLGLQESLVQLVNPGSQENRWVLLLLFVCPSKAFFLVREGQWGRPDFLGLRDLVVLTSNISLSAITQGRPGKDGIPGYEDTLFWGLGWGDLNGRSNHTFPSVAWCSVQTIEFKDWGKQPHCSVQAKQAEICSLHPRQTDRAGTSNTSPPSSQPSSCSVNPSHTVSFHSISGTIVPSSRWNHSLTQKMKDSEGQPASQALENSISFRQGWGRDITLPETELLPEEPLKEDLSKNRNSGCSGQRGVERQVDQETEVQKENGGTLAFLGNVEYRGRGKGDPGPPGPLGSPGPPGLLRSCLARASSRRIQLPSRPLMLGQALQGPLVLMAHLAPLGLQEKQDHLALKSVILVWTDWKGAGGFVKEVQGGQGGGGAISHSALLWLTAAFEMSEWPLLPGRVFHVSLATIDPHCTSICTAIESEFCSSCAARTGRLQGIEDRKERGVKLVWESLELPVSLAHQQGNNWPASPGINTGLAG
ncbi:hypothetical protein JZ751_010903 [Albula glossodonta]|uniref:Uncharacterized protein n=1 Tax=Albula glossodonta TaxID=121402 RepID=A0A8T2NVT5_9TELE|nr:hypothetical protein JZ751_010903 [Albula glossodonta]